MRLFLWLLLTACAGPSLLAQALTADSLAARYARAETGQYREVCYVQVARDLLLSGEQVWFGVLVTDGLRHRPSPLSQVAYVELGDQAGSVVWQGKIALKAGLGEGVLSLPPGLASGHYLLRAYTRWMRQADPGYFFQTWIQVVNPQAPPRRRDGASPALPLQAHWAAEGGSWVAGLPNRLAVRLSDAGGAPVAARVRLEQGGVLDSARLGPDGLAALTGTPLAGQPARLAFFQGDSLILQLALPAPAPGPASLQLDAPAEGQALAVHLHLSEGGSGAYWLALEQAGQLLALKAVAHRPGRQQVDVPSRALRGGVFRLSLLRSDGQPLASRLAMWPAATAAALPLSLPTPDSLLIPAAGAHYLASYSPTPASGPSLPAYLAELSELPQPLAHIPGLAPARQHLALAFQQGRRQAWPAILEAAAPTPWLPETEGLLLTGQLTTSTGQPMPGRDLMLGLPGRIARPIHAVSDSQGHFAFVLPPGLGQAAELVLRGPVAEDRAWKISLDPGFAPMRAPAHWPELVLSPEAWAAIEARLPYVQLQTQYAAYRPVETANPPALLPVYGRPDAVYPLDDYVPMPTEEVLREIVLEAFVRKNKRETQIRVVDAVRNTLMNQAPLMLVDGVPVFDPEEILRIPHRSLDRIEVVSEPWHQQGNLYGGILHLITREAQFEAVPLQAGDLRFTLQLCEGPGTQASAAPEAPLPDLWRSPLATTGQTLDPLRLPLSPAPSPGYLRVQVLEASGAAREGVVAWP